MLNTNNEVSNDIGRYLLNAGEKICRMMRMQVKSKVKHWSSRARYGGIRLYPDDFEDVFWETVRVTVLDDYISGSDFWLYEHILKKIDSRALDLIRYAKRDCRKHEYMAVSLDAILDMPDPRSSRTEEDAANRDLILRMMMDTSLNEGERRLLRYLYDEPDATLRQISDTLQLGHPETAKRLLSSLRKRLSKYKQYT